MSFYLQEQDKEIYSLIEKEFERQNTHLELIASENFTFPSVMEAMGSILTNKYAEGYPYKRYYGGCEFVDGIEAIAIERVKKLFGCSFANVQPHSGSQANSAVFNALLKPYDKILGMDLSHGGHLTHGAKVNASGKIYQSFGYGVDLNGCIDYEKVREMAHYIKPQLIICGFSAYTKKLDFAKFREIADEVGAILMGDVAHVAGLVVADEYPNPFPYCDVVTTTTHKTLRGPRGGVILTNNEEIASKIDKAIFPGIQGGPLMHVIAAKAVGFLENLKPEWKTYAKQIKLNINAMAEVLMQRGYKLVGNGTENHLILMDFLQKDFSGKDADLALGKAGITVNKNTVPGETRSPFITSGIRLGSPALTARGMKEDDFRFVATKIAEVLDDIHNPQVQEKVWEEVKSFSQKFKIYNQPIY